MTSTKYIFYLLLLVMPLHSTYAEQQYNVKDYGAKGDGLTLSTEAIQRTIDICAAAGGGRIIVPAGRYLTGPLFLRSNIEIEVGSGAVLLFNDDIMNTPAINGSWEGIERKVYASLLTGHDLENVRITGGGKLDGQGKAWWAAYLQTVLVREQAGITEREPDNPEGCALKYPRPRMINLYRCSNVHISGLTIVDSPAWTIHPVYCTNVVIRDISIIQPYESPNTDGINPESCRNVRITGCFIDCGDDCITLKSGYNQYGRKKGIRCENIVISDCTFAHGRSAVGIGSEMSGGVRNVTVSNCVFQGTLRGLRIKTSRGRGGIVENISASNIIMDSITVGISIDMYYESGAAKQMPFTEETPVLRNIRFSSITGTNIGEAVSITGLPESPVQVLELHDIYFESEEGISCQFAENLTLRNLVVKIQRPQAVITIRNSAGITLDNITPSTVSGEKPLIVFDSVSSGCIKNCVVNQSTNKYYEGTGSDNVILNFNTTSVQEMVKHRY